jgi:hypothetical protein
VQLPQLAVDARQDRVDRRHLVADVAHAAALPSGAQQGWHPRRRKSTTSPAARPPASRPTGRRANPGQGARCNDLHLPWEPVRASRTEVPARQASICRPARRLGNEVLAGTGDPGQDS